MARMEFITLTFIDRPPTPSQLPLGRAANPELAGCAINFVPQMYWQTDVPWHEANLWFLQQAELVSLGIRNIKTLQALGVSLKYFMEYLELHDEDWSSFPEKFSDRCLVRFRGFLVRQRDSGNIASSTCKRRMGDVLNFYDWVMNEGLLGDGAIKFEFARKIISIADCSGFVRTLTVYRNKLSISDRRSDGAGLEYGLEPLTNNQKEIVLDAAKKYGGEELYLMLLLSFSTGMRLGSICDLKIRTLSSAVQCHASEDVFYLRIGPGVKDAPVHTKFNVNGRVIIPGPVLRKIEEYCGSARRLLRVARAGKDISDLVFINRFGHPYSRGGKDSSSVINVQIFRMKRAVEEKGLQLQGFRFHSARATFASQLAVVGLKTLGLKNVPAVIGLVKKLLMHKHEKTSLAYISFVQQQEIIEGFSEELSWFDVRDGL